MKPSFEKFNWIKDEMNFKKWTSGKTGYPVVDAAMKQLWNIGWMHNRARMIVASFLTKHLLIPWQWGADWFHHTLLDASLASNYASWQWVAGCGADAAPYFRIFNPETQAIKFDPEGKFIKKHLPIFRQLDKKLCHNPNQSDLDLNYPKFRRRNKKFYPQLFHKYLLLQGRAIAGPIRLQHVSDTTAI